MTTTGAENLVHVMMSNHERIPYDEIDPLARGLVRVLNEDWGVETTASCSGHDSGDEAYVSFIADRQELVCELLRALPIKGWSGGFAWNRPVAKAVWVTVDPDEKGLRYDLRMSGYPEYARKELILEVEDALRAASPARQKSAFMRTRPVQNETGTR